MASTNKTSNLELSQFIATDTPTWLVDYNGDMEKIDAGVGRVEELAETASTQAVGVSNGLQTTNANVTTLSGQVANVQNQANNNTASVNGINQRLGNTDISSIGDGTITGAINSISAGGGGTGITVPDYANFKTNIVTPGTRVNYTATEAGVFNYINYIDVDATEKLIVNGSKQVAEINSRVNAHTDTVSVFLNVGDTITSSLTMSATYTALTNFVPFKIG